MRRFKLLILLLAVCYAVGSAQEVQKFEGEINVGLTCPIGNFHNGEKQVGPEIGVEFRYDMPDTKWDFGALLNMTTTVYRYYDTNSDWYWDQSNRGLNLVALADYNFKQGSKFNPYVGLGVGLSAYDTVHEIKYDNSGVSFIVRPRVGIEMFTRVRLAAFASLSRVGYNSVGFTIGYVFGGRPVK
jgi:opacity protein-like surface antigen